MEDKIIGNAIKNQIPAAFILVLLLIFLNFWAVQTLSARLQDAVAIPIFNASISPSQSNVKAQYAGANIVIITIDTLRADHLGCFGYERNTTPNIDSISAEGFLFSQAYTSRSLTGPSLTSLMTSLYPITHGLRDNGYVMSPKIDTLARILQRNGYQTAAYNAYHCNKKRFGFSHFFCALNNDQKVASSAINWIKKNSEKRFFLWVHLFSPHAPYEPPKGYDIFKPLGYSGPDYSTKKSIYSIKADSPTLPKGDIDRIVSLYDAEVRYADDQVGRISKALEDLSLDDNTIIVILADHGEDIYEHNKYLFHGCSIYDSSLHIPLIFKLPDKASKGMNDDGIVEIVDVSPTLLELIGLPSPTHFQGTSLLPVISGDGKKAKNQATVAELKAKIFSDRPIHCQASGSNGGTKRSPLEPMPSAFVIISAKCTIAGSNGSLYF